MSNMRRLGRRRMATFAFVGILLASGLAAFSAWRAYDRAQRIKAAWVAAASLRNTSFRLWSILPPPALLQVPVPIGLGRMLHGNEPMLQEMLARASTVARCLEGVAVPTNGDPEVRDLKWGASVGAASAQQLLLELSYPAETPGLMGAMRNLKTAAHLLMREPKGGGAAETATHACLGS